MLRKLLVLGLLTSVLSGVALSASVTPIPTSIDFGNVQPGEEIEYDMYVRVNDIHQNFTTNPRISSASPNMLDEGDERRFSVSEKGVSDWVEVEEVVVDPDSEWTTEIEDGSIQRVNGEFNFVLDVPSDAEPGYHHGSMVLNPDLDTDDGGAGALTFGTTRMRFLVEVEGDADRELTVDDVRGFRMDDDTASVEMRLRNTGTVTVSTDEVEMEVLDQNGNLAGTLTSTGTKLEPGESEWVGSTWRQSGEIEEGTYTVDGEVDYFTGQAFSSGTFSLPGIDRVEVVPEDSPQSDEQDQDTIPLWLIVMILVVLGVLMWSFDIEPFWILAVLGFIGISAFILLSGVSNWILLILILIGAILFYGVM